MNKMLILSDKAKVTQKILYPQRTSGKQITKAECYS